MKRRQLCVTVSSGKLKHSRRQHTFLLERQCSLPVALVVSSEEMECFDMLVQGEAVREDTHI